MSNNKLKAALYWAGSCGGCEIAVLDLNEKILDVANALEIVLWPVAVDFKYEDLRSMADKSIDVALINGVIRNSEQKEIVELLREKSKLVVAFGSCACLGGIPSLANLFSRDEILRRAYKETESTVNPGFTVPTEVWKSPVGVLTLPRFFGTTFKLDDVIAVDYYVPGCPPPPDLVFSAVTALVKGEAPPPGSVLAPEQPLCFSCPREKGEKQVEGFRRVHQTLVDPKQCLLEQGIICCGPATRDGCGARCVSANMPCRGCFGPTPEAVEQGAKLAGAIATMISGNDEDSVTRAVSGIKDPVGTFYRFSVAASMLRLGRRRLKLEEERARERVAS